MTAEIQTKPTSSFFSLASLQDRELAKQVLWVALSAIFGIGLILSYTLGAPWFVPFTFFSLALISLFPVGRVAEIQIKNPENKLIKN